MSGADVLTAVAAVLVALIAAGSAALTAWVVRTNRRIRRLERRDRLSWLYIQRLIVHATVHAPDIALPPPPDGWLDIESEEKT